MKCFYFRSNDKQSVPNIALTADNEIDLTSDNIPERLFACKYCDKKYVLAKWLDKHISEHGILRFYFRLISLLNYYILQSVAPSV